MVERDLAHDHFGYFFTGHFGLTRDDYQDKRVLDIGCGPRGSLEWADIAASRIGVDPLSHAYRSLGAARHAMSYVAAAAGSLPFPAAYFNIVASFNSLDHVDDLRSAAAEIVRVLKPGGVFLLLVDVNHAPTVLEPITLGWEASRLLFPQLDAVDVQHYEKAGGMYDSLRAGVAYDHVDPSVRPGILSALLRKP